LGGFNLREITEHSSGRIKADDLLDEGIYAIGFSFPVVPKGEVRIRTQLSALHTREEIERAIAAFVKVGKKHGVIA